MKITKILTAASAAVVAAAALAATAGAYNAYLGYQTNPYSFRNAWDDGTYGIDSGYFDNVIVWGNSNDMDQTFPEYADYYDWDIEAYVMDGGFTDAVVEADGTYTVSSDAFEWSMDGASGFNLIFVSTDIPSTATVTSATLYIDGVEQMTVANPVCEDKDTIHFNLCNIWNPDVEAYTGAYPTETISVEFTVEGLGGAAEAPAEDAATTAPAGDKTSPDTGVEGVAVVAGTAIVAAGAMLLSKKRK